MAQIADAPTAHHARCPRGSRAAPSRDAAGLATLEWLLVIAATGGFAAVMAVALQSVIDDASTTGSDTDSRLIDAGIAAARASDEAVRALIASEASPGDPQRTAAAQAALAALAQQCESIKTAYPDVVESADWTWQTVPIQTPAPAPAAVPGTEPPTTAGDSHTPQSPVTTAPPDTADAPALADGRWVCQIRHRAP